MGHDNCNALLALSDGSVFYGRSIGAVGESIGEVVFNTAMTGYQEILTDPSYARQIVTLTYPHIGNTGSNASDNESSNVHAAGLVIRDLPLLASNWRNSEPLDVFLKRHGVVAIADIDTRRLTRLLRDKGALSGAVLGLDAVCEGGAAQTQIANRAVELARAFPGLAGMDLAQAVTCAAAYHWDEGSINVTATAVDSRTAESAQQGVTAAGSRPVSAARRWHVVALDFGVKHNILRMLVDRNCTLTVVPATTSAAEILKLDPDGVFLSNGPGDPEPCAYAIATIRELLDRHVPLFGICLGHQLLALAAGGRTRKMKFGHHGANHPVQDLATGSVMISSQNHGFTVDADSLGSSLRATHESLFDRSLQGIEHTERPAFSFQGHPEASPWPHDVAPLFDRFIKLMSEHTPRSDRAVSLQE